MSWKDLFFKGVLDRGQDYFYRGLVLNFKSDEDSCSAVVVGSHRYDVRIRRNVFGDYNMSCSCLFARQGGNCKHMAAVLYKWENEQEKKTRVIVNPFSQEDYRDCFFNMHRIAAELKIEQSRLDAADTVLNSQEFRVTGIAPGHSRLNGEPVLNAEASLSGGYHPGMVSLEMTKNALSEGRCTVCGTYYGKGSYVRQICHHMLALLIETGRYVRKYNPGDETSRGGQDLLDRFGRMRSLSPSAESAAAPQKVIRLDPRVTNRNGELMLGYRIGIDRMYMLKNMSELVDLYKHRSAMNLGKDHDLFFRYQDFAESAEDSYRFIENKVLEANALNFRFRYSYDIDVSVRGSIALEGKTLDDFYDLYNGKTVEYVSDDKRESRLKLEDRDPGIRLGIEPYYSGGRICGVILIYDRPQTFEGAGSRYFLKDGVLSRIPEEDYPVLAPFFEGEETENSSVIGEKHLSEFYYRVLPELRKHPQIEITESDPEAVRAILPPEAQFGFYLDREDSEILCKGEITYNDTKLPLRELKDGDFPLPPYRDVPQELAALNTVIEYLPVYDAERECFVQEKDDDRIYELLSEGIGRLLEIGEVHTSDSFERLKIRRVPAVSVGVSVDHDLLNLEILSDGLSNGELLELLQSYRRKKKYHRLKNGDYVSLEQAETLETVQAMMDALDISLKDFVAGRMHMPAYRSLYINKLLEEHEEIAAERDRNFRALIKNISTVRDSDYEVPSSLKGTLRNYQEYGFQWLHSLSDLNFGGILADDMGLGKTLQMITLLLARKEEYELVLPALVVCPASLVYNWEEEFKRFAPQLKTALMAGSLAERREVLKRKDYDVLITSYDLLKRDVDLYENKTFSYEILDEGQYIKNPKAVISKAVKIIRSAHRFVLTGTPIENRLSELWSIFDYLMPGFLYSYDRFRSEFENGIVKNKDEYLTKRLRQMVSPFILRRSKNDVLKELPEKIEELRYARFGEEQQKIYDGQVVHMKQLVGQLEESSGESKIRILAELMKIRQICCDPNLLLENYRGESAKKEACLQLIESAIDGGHKMLVFSQFTSMLEILEQELGSRNIPCYKITGATPKEERLKLVHRFNDDEVPVFLISLKAGGTGLNLTGADIVIHYDPWWNVAAQNQATDRAHRIGQDKVVSVFKLIAKDTIEEKILELQLNKKDLADSILSGEHTSITSLTKDELLQLLG